MVILTQQLELLCNSVKILMHWAAEANASARDVHCLVELHERTRTTAVCYREVCLLPELTQGELATAAAYCMCAVHV